MVESIKELREICQKRKFLYDKKGKESKSKPAVEYIYDRGLRIFSIYFTKLFLYIPVTSNQVTIISMFVGVMAGILFTFEQPLYWIIGFLFIQLFHVLDCTDGEVARYRETCSPIGRYFDLMAHGVVISAFYIGATVGVYRAVGHANVFLFGMASGALFLLGTVSTALRNFLFTQYAAWKNDQSIIKKMKSRFKMRHTSWRYIIRRMTGFDGLGFVILIAAILDFIFKPVVINRMIFNWRYAFLIFSAIFLFFSLIKRMHSIANLQGIFKK